MRRQSHRSRRTCGCLRRTRSPARSAPNSAPPSSSPRSKSKPPRPPTSPRSLTTCRCSAAGTTAPRSSAPAKSFSQGKIPPAKRHGPSAASSTAPPAYPSATPNPWPKPLRPAFEAPPHPTDNISHQQKPERDHCCERGKCHYFLEHGCFNGEVARIQPHSVGTVRLSLRWGISVVRMRLLPLSAGPLFLSCLVCKHSAQRD